MILRITHSKFDFNLVDTSFTVIEEIQWFKDGFFTNYSYPITYTLSENEEAELDYITSFFSRGYDTIYNVLFSKQYRVFEAVFEIDVIEGNSIAGKIRYGMEEFPNFQTKLALLPLHNFEIASGTAYDFAETKVNLAYPATDYNFPTIFTDSLDTNDEKWQAFLGRVNNYVGNNFLENSYDIDNDLQINLNVLQPLPYLLYVLKTGFADAGYTLAGDILEDPVLQKTLLFNLSSYYTSVNNDNQITLSLNEDDFDNLSPSNSDYIVFDNHQNLTVSARYLVSGVLILRRAPSFSTVFASFYLGENILHTQVLQISDPNDKTYLLNFSFDVLPSDTPQQLRYVILTYGGNAQSDDYPQPVLDITISQLVKYGLNGELIPTLVAPTRIDLTKCLPDVTFGELFNFVQLSKGYDVVFEGNTVFLNLIKDQIGAQPVISLEQYQVKAPRIEINKTKAFELKYNQEDTEQYSFTSILIKGTSVETSPYSLPAEVETTVLNALPLPLKTEGSITTAHSFIDDAKKIQLVIYDGLINGLNTCLNPSPYSIVSLYQSHLKPLYDFRLNGNTYKWTFLTTDLALLSLKVKDTVFAYGQLFVVTKLTQKNVSKNVMEVAIEAISI